jgi:hypothetical protein
MLPRHEFGTDAVLPSRVPNMGRWRHLGLDLPANVKSVQGADVLIPITPTQGRSRAGDVFERWRGNDIAFVTGCAADESRRPLWCMIVRPVFRTANAITFYVDETT